MQKDDRKYRLEGTVQNRWTVLKFLRRERPRNIYLCRCECGTEKEVLSSGSSLISKCCGCKRVPNWKKGRKSPVNEIDIYSTLRTRYKKDAKIRNLSFELTNEQFKEFIIKPCYYCGADKPQKQMYNNWGEVKYTGIDRVDNTKGYAVENCVPCCGKCNVIKKAVTPEIIKKAYDFLFGEK